MKLQTIVLGFIVILNTFVIDLAAQKNPYPSDEAIKSAGLGEVIFKEGVFKTGEKEYKADYGKIVVPENREKKASRTINIPIVKIYSTNKRPVEPVFLLAGGPANSNIWRKPKEWLLKNHDIVMVGYRGFDGSVLLKTPEVGKVLKVKSDPFSNKNLRQLGDALNAGLERLTREGVDLAGYNMIEVIDDIELVRKKLNYKKINLLSVSYGTRVAYIYGLRYPDSINRSFMYCVNTPGHFVWEPDIIKSQLEYYNELWKKDKAALKKSGDLLQTMRGVLRALPASWNGFAIDRDKVKAISFFQLFHVNTAVMVFDAFVAAEKGDYSGVAYLSVAYDMMMSSGWAQSWGEAYAKAASADYDEKRDYESEMMPKGAILGSPMSKLMWPLMKYCKYKIKLIPGKYRKLQYSEVPTLMLNGSIDFSTPVENAKSLLPYLKNGKLVILKEMGHGNDLSGLQPMAFQHLVETFFLTGAVDDSRFKYQPIDFKPVGTFQEMAKSRQ